MTEAMDTIQIEPEIGTQPVPERWLTLLAALTDAQRQRSHVAVRRKPEEWQALLPALTPFQRRIFRAAKRTDDDVAMLAERLFGRAVWVYELMLVAEAGRFGHYAQASLADQVILAQIEEETEESAFSIVHTYNYELIEAIEAIGEEHEGEEAWLYSLLLFGAGGWWDRRRAWKDTQIGTWETWRRINQALGDFYERNPDLPVELAEVVPYDAVCPVCRLLVAGNPYPPGQVVEIARQLPAHLNCPHYVHTIPAGKAEGPLWLGG